MSHDFPAWLLSKETFMLINHRKLSGGIADFVDFFVIGKEFASFVMLQRYVRGNPPGDHYLDQAMKIPALFNASVPKRHLNAEMLTIFPSVHL
jgi:hypothetical protein